MRGGASKRRTKRARGDEKSHQSRNPLEPSHVPRKGGVFRLPQWFESFSRVPARHAVQFLCCRMVGYAWFLELKCGTSTIVRGSPFESRVFVLFFSPPFAFGKSAGVWFGSPRRSPTERRPTCGFLDWLDEYWGGIARYGRKRITTESEGRIDCRIRLLRVRVSAYRQNPRTPKPSLDQRTAYAFAA